MAGKKAKPRKTVKKLVLESLKPSDVLCPICRTILIEPVSLSCNHAFCKLCFEATMENANLVCPLCRVRVGSWFRKAKKEGKLVNEMLWEAIQSQYPTEIKNRYQGIDNVMEEDVPVIVVATPGEIRKEYEQQRQKDLEEQKRITEAEEKASAPLIKKLREEEEHKNRVEEEKLRLDAALAKKLAADLERPTTSKYPHKKMTEQKKLGSNRKYGPMDKFIKVEDTKSNRQSLNKGEEQKSLYKGGRKRISITPNPANDFATKEYTCHVLNAESRSKGTTNSMSLLNKSNYNKPSYTSGMSTAQKKVKETRKIVAPVERKSTSKSGYKSSGSGSDDAIDQECKFYFKPIDTQRRHHLPGTIPVKVPSLRGQLPLNVCIGPPSGKIINLQLGTVISAFAEFSMALQKKPESKNTPPPKVMADVKLNYCVGSSNKLKRKLSDMDSPVRRKDRRQIYTKKNVLLIDKRKIISSPFYGFDDESSRSVNSYPFYGFSIQEIKHSNREKDAMNKIIAKGEKSEPDNKSVISLGGYHRAFKTYSRYQNKQFKEPRRSSSDKSTEESLKLKISRTSENDSNILSTKDAEVDLKGSMKDPSEDYKLKTSIDINRNIPKEPSQPSISKLGDRTNNESGINGNRSLKNKTSLKNVKKIEDGSGKNLTTGNINQVKGFSNKKLYSKNLDVRSEDMSKIINNKLINELDIPLKLRKDDSRVYMDTDSKIRSEIMGIEDDTDDYLPKASSTRMVKGRSGADTNLVSSIEDNRSDKSHPNNNVSNDSNTIKSRLQPLNTSSSPVNGSWRTRSKKGSPKKALDSLNKRGAISETMNGDSLKLDRIYSTIKNTQIGGASTDSSAPSKSIRLNDTVSHPVNKMYQSKLRNAVVTDTNSRITDTFFKVKSSPTKSKNTIKLSPANAKFNNNVELDLDSIEVNNCEIDDDRRQIQEQSDFEIAKRLQAEFDSIQMPSRTRRGTKRQITLDEMLLV